MKKMVTSELSNSMILNENEENLQFRKEINVDSSKSVSVPVKGHSVKRQRNDSERSSPMDFSSGSNEGRSSSKSAHCKHHKQYSETKELPKSGRSQSSENRSLPESFEGIGNYKLVPYLTTSLIISLNIKNISTYFVRIQKKMSS